MKPVGLEGSGGSTPLKMRIVDDQGVERSVFAKLYAKSHVRADRWYKLGRTMLTAASRTRHPSSTVRRFVEHEDYTLRLLGEKGLSTPGSRSTSSRSRPSGEYLIAMEFFEDVCRDQRSRGRRGNHRRWAAADPEDVGLGLSHRDIKPANLMVQDGRLRLIDVFFVQVRPSPWRQAVDLGNMMLVLASLGLHLVYERALALLHTPGAVRGLRRDPGRRQPDAAAGIAEGGRPRCCWRPSASSRRRASPSVTSGGASAAWCSIVATVLLLLLAVLTGIALFIPSRGDVWNATCGTGWTMQLMAQAVPTATKLPCIGDLPLGWGTEQATVARGSGEASRSGIGSDRVSPAPHP